ncbi:MAG: carbon-nitrogen hydrolase family protein [Kiritimatiellia bacterium]
MRVGLVQLAANLVTAGDCHHYAAYVRDAAAAGCRWVVFPELSDTGYDLAGRDLCTPAHEMAVADAAKTHQVWVFAGMCERSVEGQWFDALKVFSPAGRLAGCYRKLHLFRDAQVDETHYFEAGSRPVIIDVDGVKVGLCVCFDLRFPTLYRAYAVSGAEVLLTVAAWPMARIADWRLLQCARALENQAYTLGVNYCGTKGRFCFGGSSLACGPDGSELAVGNPFDAELVVCDLDIERIGKVRQSLPVLAAERDVFGGKRE